MTRAFAAAALLSCAAGAAAAADASVQVGSLTCELADKTNLVIVSTSEFTCRFDHVAGGQPESYRGTIRKLGVDLTLTQAQTFVWLVLAPSADVPKGALAGEYLGASADAALGVGAGARLLVGGSGDSIALQPVALQGERGFGIAAGLEAIVLESAG
jgi:hypothetical protein